MSNLRTTILTNLGDNSIDIKSNIDKSDFCFQFFNASNIADLADFLSREDNTKTQKF